MTILLRIIIQPDGPTPLENLSDDGPSRPVIIFRDLGGRARSFLYMSARYATGCLTYNTFHVYNIIIYKYRLLYELYKLDIIIIAEVVIYVHTIT